LRVGVGFERLIELDIILYGLALLLEFAALVALRVREPGLPRPFRIPGGLPAVVLLGLGPAALLCLAFMHEARPGQVGGTLLGVLLAGAGPLLYALSTRFRIGRAD
jgi:amino acid transporter